MKPIDDTFFEAEPTVAEELKQCIPTKDGTLRYLTSLFPCFGWLPRYNWRWLVGDSIAGLTVGLVVIPQAMAFGLYTSFAGAATYWLFGTSKDIVIGVCQTASPSI
jgi:sodium-independent sulfate anion transporter 11